MRSTRPWTLIASGLALSAGLFVSGPVFAAGSTGQTLSVEATAYAPTAQDNYPYGPVDLYGRPLTAGDIAVDPTVFPLKSCLYVTGYQSPYLPAGGFIGEADDEGGAIQGKHIDIFINASESQVNSFGIQTVQVTLLGPATNPSAAGTAACAGYGNGTAGHSTASSPTTSASSSAPQQNGGSATGSVRSSASASGTQAGGSPAGAPPATSGSLGPAIVQRALSELGAPYVWGGTTPAGFDCSGFVQWVFGQEGISLPRLSGQQYGVGTPVSRSALQPGDLVFFTTYKPGPSHVGIYIGAYQGIQHAFIAADNPAVGVRIDNLDAQKWVPIFVGARQIVPPAPQSSTGSTSPSSTPTNTGPTSSTSASPSISPNASSTQTALAGGSQSSGRHGSWRHGWDHDGWQ
ncbi:MAG: NlpC/P60 family protein [Clostridia bacterium]